MRQAPQSARLRHAVSRAVRLASLARAAWLPGSAAGAVQAGRRSPGVSRKLRRGGCFTPIFSFMPSWPLRPLGRPCCRAAGWAPGDLRTVRLGPSVTCAASPLVLVAWRDLPAPSVRLKVSVCLSPGCSAQGCQPGPSQCRRPSGAWQQRRHQGHTGATGAFATLLGQDSGKEPDPSPGVAPVRYQGAAVCRKQSVFCR